MAKLAELSQDLPESDPTRASSAEIGPHTANETSQNVWSKPMRRVGPRLRDGTRRLPTARSVRIALAAVGDPPDPSPSANPRPSPSLVLVKRTPSALVLAASVRRQRCQREEKTTSADLRATSTAFGPVSRPSKWAAVDVNPEQAAVSASYKWADVGGRQLQHMCCHVPEDPLVNSRGKYFGPCGAAEPCSLRTGYWPTQRNPELPPSWLLGGMRHSLKSPHAGASRACQPSRGHDCGGHGGQEPEVPNGPGVGRRRHSGLRARAQHPRRPRISV